MSSIATNSQGNVREYHNAWEWSPCIRGLYTYLSSYSLQ